MNHLQLYAYQQSGTILNHIRICKLQEAISRVAGRFFLLCVFFLFIVLYLNSRFYEEEL